MHVGNQSVMLKCLRKLSPHFMLCNNSIEPKVKKNIELIACLLVAEQNNQLLMKNHEIRPIGLHSQKRTWQHIMIMMEVAFVVMTMDEVMVVVKVLDLVKEIFMVVGLRTHLATRSSKIIKNDKGGKKRAS